MILENVHYKYRKSNSYILKNLNVDFTQNTINVIVGLNGAGKTTLFDIIAGLHKVVPGIKNRYKVEDIAYQMQGVPLLSSLKGCDIARLFMNTDKKTNMKKKLSAESILNADATVEEIKLGSSLWDKEYGKMSPGERRWLIISCFCKLERKLYIFDEPTSGVDPISRGKIIKNIKKLGTDPQKKIILSTHLLHDLEQIDGNIYLLHKGKVLFNGFYSEFLSVSHTQNPNDAFEYFINHYNNTYT
ncbi:ATP-binding cassette domain-containing protein [Shouchella miscanthi]|uniref:ATP-binding cassette domain-containing protein n=1 Tax=Shouchella miscanthi TaxID=2598861 RepID=A0ABU6NML4_9BACI|nr:ATP-binding cassette domain-containing protein [Shouchella miscanthi]MED4129433.1 ATP-binding cassette domain-containing protein [Shouchella miscanthi]